MAAVISSCSTLRKAFQQDASITANRTASTLQFIEPIEIKSAEKQSQVLQQNTVGRSSLAQIPGSQAKAADLPDALGDYSSLQYKYAMRMDVPATNLLNIPLYQFIEEWWGAPYRFGGNTRAGIDCSAFVQTLMQGVFSQKLPRTSGEQKTFAQQISDAERREGDLVFFSTSRGNAISHVGIYLHNDKFVHASTSKGVVISDLKETYWSKRYRGAGRVVLNISAKQP